MWWHRTDLLARFMDDLVASEIAVLRPQLGGPGSGGTSLQRPLPDRLDLAARYHLDSLELVQLATRISVALDLGASGIDDYLLARRTLADWREIAAAGLDRASERMTFLTSGSTGRARPCPHLLADLSGEIEALLPVLDGAARIVTLVPAHHIYGFLFSILLPSRLAVEVLDGRDMAGTGLLRRLRPGDLVVGFPDRYASLVNAGSPPHGVTALTSTAPCPAGLQDALEAVGWSGVVEIYGSSETGGLGVRTGGHEPFALIAPWRPADGVPPGDVAGRDLGGSDMLQRAGRPPIQAPDRLEWTGPRHFRPAGRLDGAVQVMGMNVFPERVRAVLRSHPAVEDAAVRLTRSGGAARLKAFVVSKGAPLDGEGLAHWAETRLSPPERPRHWRFGQALPTGPMGKPADWPMEGEE